VADQGRLHFSNLVVATFEIKIYTIVIETVIGKIRIFPMIETVVGVTYERIKRKSSRD
jgi:hypothetical protein